MMKNLFVFSGALLMLSGCQSAPVAALKTECVEVRGVIDIGSGATKLKVARVNYCEQKVLEILADDSVKVGYSADLKKSADQNLANEVRRAGLAAIQALVAKGKALKPVQWFGFATSAFRTAKNGREVIAAYAKETGLRLEVISQEQEGILGFSAGVQAATVPIDQVVVWDIGGGSQQFAFKNGTEVKVIKLEDRASEKFKEIVIRQVKRDARSSTPNPIGEKNLKAALREAQKFAEGVKFSFVPAQVIGIGGVHAKGFEKTLAGKKLYTQSDLAAASKLYASQTDAELNDAYADTLVSNLILVQGMMQRLKFKSVTVSNFGGSEGALIYPQYWH